MANGVHTAVKPVQPTGPHPVRNAVVTEAKRDQLRHA